MLTAMYTQTEEVTLSTPEMSTLTGLTYRQLDYWVRNRVIPSYWILGDNLPGSGRQRRWRSEAIEPLIVAARINRQLGRGTNLSSADMARVVRNYKDGYLDFGGGIRLTWT